MKKKFLTFTGLSLLLFVSILVSTAFGSVTVPLTETISIVLSKIPFFDVNSTWSKVNEVIILNVRLPRVLVGVLVGGALSLAGAVMQGLFRNPMADPGIIGVTSGGALGAVIAIYFGWSAKYFFVLPFFSFVGAFLSLLLVYLIAADHGKVPVTLLLLSGIAVSGLAISMTSLIITLSLKSYELGNQIIFWLMGGLDGRSWAHIKMALPIIILCAGIIFSFSSDLNIMLFGEDSAQGLGVNVKWARIILLGLSALITGTAVAVSGAISFVGLVIPHIMRLVVGPNHQRLLPTSFLAGAAFLPLADLLCRTMIRPSELRLGVVTSFIGGPFFIYLLIRKKRGEKSF